MAGSVVYKKDDLPISLFNLIVEVFQPVLEQDKGHQGFLVEPVVHIPVWLYVFQKHICLATFSMTNGLILTLPVALAVKATWILSFDHFIPFMLLEASAEFGPRR